MTQIIYQHPHYQPNSPEQCDLLVIGAHPDDIEIGVGGIVLNSVAQGKKVVLIDCTASEKSTRGTVQTRLLETQKASALLGVEARYCLGLPDTALYDNHEARARLAKLIKTLKPTIVLAPWRKDDHPDHISASVITKNAVFLARCNHFPSPNSGMWPYATLGYYTLRSSFKPSIIVDIGPFVEKKHRVISCYASQFSSQDSRYPPTELSTHFEKELQLRDRHFALGTDFNAAEGILWDKPVAEKHLFRPHTPNVS